MSSSAGHWHVPADTAPQERVWIAFPPAQSVNTATSWQLSSARRAWARIIHTINDELPVALVVDPADRQILHTYVDTAIPYLTVPINNAQIGRTGPTFGLGPAKKNKHRRPLGMIDWTFNGFGRRTGVEYKLDDVANGTLAELMGEERAPVTRSMSMMVNEGGAWVSDGDGTAIASASILTDPRRNPGWSVSTVERELKRLTDLESIIWLPGGLTRGSAKGIGGHVDQLVTFIEPGAVLLHWQADPTHPDHSISVEAEKLLSQARDAKGRRLEVVRVPAPQTHSDAIGPVAWSYVDLRPLNSTLLAPRFIDPHDDEAFEILSAVFADRQLHPVISQELYDRGASIRAITLPQPRSGPSRRAR
ncbi:MAG: agmatine deiminase family protein [Micrococcaceae bacterium]